MARLELNKQIDIAVRAIRALEPRPEKRQTADMMAPAQLRQGGLVGEQTFLHGYLSWQRCPAILRRSDLFVQSLLIIPTLAISTHSPARIARRYHIPRRHGA